MSVAALITLHLRVQSRYWRSRSLRSGSQIPKQSPMNLWWLLSILNERRFVLKNRNPYHSKTRDLGVFSVAEKRLESVQFHRRSKNSLKMWLFCSEVLNAIESSMPNAWKALKGKYGHRMLSHDSHWLTAILCSIVRVEVAMRRQKGGTLLGNLGEVVQPLPDVDVAKTTDNGVQQSN
ncbi:unnamed protein product [Sphagnum troendelagicum]|uniref:Uncharacterized protein n=1 Tax=Sphagnum troendelagicum TaxID=128251 RepID=A0ABP0TQR5_9BRYO